MTNYTYEEKQRALNEAHELMKTDTERLEGTKEYISGAKARHTTPILNEEDLIFLVEQADTNRLNNKAFQYAVEDAVKLNKENKKLREAVKISMDYVQDGRNPRANKLYKYLQCVLEGEK